MPFLSRNRHCFVHPLSADLFKLNTVLLKSEQQNSVQQTSMQENNCLKLSQISNQLWFRKYEQHLVIEYNFYRQMSLSKSKCWYSNHCLHFLKQAVPFSHTFLAPTQQCYVLDNGYLTLRISLHVGYFQTPLSYISCEKRVVVRTKSNLLQTICLQNT